METKLPEVTWRKLPPGEIVELTPNPLIDEAIRAMGLQERISRLCNPSIIIRQRDQCRFCGRPMFILQGLMAPRHDQTDLYAHYACVRRETR